MCSCCWKGQLHVYFHVFVQSIHATDNVAKYYLFHLPVPYRWLAGVYMCMRVREMRCNISRGVNNQTCSFSFLASVPILFFKLRKNAIL